MNDQTAKADAGKLELSLVPTQIIRDIAEVRMYGNQKYHDPDNWKTVELERYVNALYRHFLAYIDNPDSVDEESGIPHYKHMACNMAFICEMAKNDAKPVLPGKWVHYDINGKITEEDVGNILYSKCSNCGLEIGSKSQEMPYCQNCGAKMDAE